MKENCIVLICHDEKAQTWDIIDINRILDGEEFIDVISDGCDYERYKDTNIANLTDKIIKEWKYIKEKILDSMFKDIFDKAFEMNGFCMILEKY